MSLSPQAIPQLMIQLTDIGNGTDNTIIQTINQNITIYVLESPDVPENTGLQGFIQTNSELNQGNQSLTQVMGDFPLFPNYYTLDTEQLQPQNINLDFTDLLNNDGNLRTLLHDNQRVVITGDENIVDLDSEQIIYDLSWYAELPGETFTFDSFLNDFVGDYLVDSLQVAVQDVLINAGNNNQISTNIKQTLATFLVVDNLNFNDDLPSQPIQFIFQENFNDDYNNQINQIIEQNIHFDFTFTASNFNSVNQSTGVEIIEPNFEIDNFVNPILDNQVPDADLSQNHQITANLKNSQVTDILGNQNTDSKSTSLITVLTRDESINSQDDVSLSELINQVQTLVLTGDETELTPANLTSLFEQIINQSNFTVAPPIINEGYAEFVITRSGDLSRYVKLEYITEDKLAKAGVNYLPTVGQVIFAPDEVSKTIRVPIIDSEEFNLVTQVINYSSENLAEEFNIYVDSLNRKITLGDYHRFIDNNQSLTEGYLDFEVKTNKRKIPVKVFLDGVNNVNSYFAFNPEAEEFQEFIYDGSIGARFLPNNQGVRLRLDNNITHQGFFARTTPGLINDHNQVFFVPTAADGKLQSRLINSPDGTDYEVGFIQVDNLNGKIGRLNPGDSGYQQAAEARQKIVLFKNHYSAASRSLTQEIARESFTNPRVLREGESKFFGHLKDVQLRGNRYYQLYLKKDGEISFSVEQPLDIVSEGRGYHHLSFDNEKLTLELSSNVLVTPASFTQPVTVNISRAASYDNLVALFVVDAFDGGIDVNGDKLIDTRPGDEDYPIIALTRAKDPLTGITLITPDGFFSTTNQNINLAENTIYGMVLIPNTTIDDVLNNNPDAAIFSFSEANRGGISHLTRLGANLFVFEDILGGGDLDYNDVILEFQFS
ncbi:MAG: DUF4114 domain-containing protein [Gloeocapsa sp. DLM2.Bin57]|nr:MAG: DUF4114 domain-containing protein [Gloeocapsa sp. DLM2.Bin57]